MAKEKNTTNNTAILGYSSLFLQRTELIVGVMLTMAAVLFHLVFFQSAGAFWRDEVNSINLATMLSIADICQHLKYDSFPILLSLILRLWVGLITGSEWGLRLFGFLIGVSILGAFWLNGRLLGYRVPLLSIAFFEFNALSIRIGDAIRPYGLGMLLILMTFGLFWKVTEQGKPIQIIVGAISAVLCVQCLYQNAFFLAAVIFAGIVITIRNKRWKRAVLLIFMGFVAAASILPYAQSIRNASGWAVILKYPVDFPLIWSQFSKAITVSGHITFQIIVSLLFAWLLAFIYIQIVRSKADISKPRKELTLFCVSTVFIFVLLYFIFLRIAGICPSVWYYLPPMAVIAISLDVVFSSLNYWWRVFRIAAAILIAAVSFSATWPQVHLRQTNMDIVASTLEKSIGKNDLIIVNPWYFAVSFQHYYHGLVPFKTLPPIKDYEVHRDDLIKEKMVATDPIRQVLTEISGTLKSGGSVFVVGEMPFLNQNELPQMLQPAPNSICGWSMRDYVTSWEQQLAYLVQRHSIKTSVLLPSSNNPINPLENCSIMVFNGWI